MGLILDSHALIWWATDADVLSGAAREAAEAGRSDLHVSVATAWELEIKRASGKLQLVRLDWDRLAAQHVSIIPISLADALAAARLPLHHRDPFDRMIIAQALNRGLTVITRDRTFEHYGVPTLRA